MPFQKIYALDFRSSRTFPVTNLYQWPEPRFSPVSEIVKHQFDYDGLRLDIYRPANTTDEIRNSVYVVPPGGIPLESRLYIKVTFNHPNASGEWLMGAPGRKSQKPGTKAGLTSKKSAALTSVATRPDFSEEIESYLHPEPWAVALCFSSTHALDDPKKMAIVNVQFGRREGSTGIRLSTPNAPPPRNYVLQSDEPVFLESPLVYSKFNPAIDGQAVIHEPGLDDFRTPDVPSFTLIHSFSGRDMMSNHHTTGAGYLNISRKGSEDSTDHRVYSHAAIAETSIMGNEHQGTSARIRALGINLASAKGYGHMSVHLQSFEIWRDIGSAPLSIGPQPI